MARKTGIRHSIQRAATVAGTAAIEARSGTYVVLYRCPSAASVPVGRWGELSVRRGWYLYVGSAFGPGGVHARVARHCRRDKALRWHIDYLRDSLVPRAAWYTHAAQRLEHHWADCLTRMAGATPIEGFGCSDCHCRSHLYHFITKPRLSTFERLAGRPIASRTCV